MKKLEKESERLNSLLPSEIAALRLKLEEGAPCPVCGSLHHPTSGVQEDTLEEKKINKAKKEIQEARGTLAQEIEDRRSEMIRLQSLVDSYSSQIKETTIKLEEYLSVLPEWQTLFQQGKLSSWLRQLAQDWSGMTKGQTEAIAHKDKWENALQLGSEQYKEIVEQEELMEQQLKDCVAHGKQLHEERSALFSGRPVDEVETAYSANLQKQGETHTKNIRENQAITTKYANNAGTITQLTSAITVLADRSGVLQRELEAWLEEKEKELSREQLAELLSHDGSWIVKERMELNTLQQNKVSASARFNERRKLLEEHADSPDKVSPGETIELLREKMTVQTEALELKKKRKTEIEIARENHAKGKEKIKTFEKELNDKTQISENWKKLNELYGSADGSKFKVLAQGYTLEALLAYANRHLQELTSRYVLQRIPDTLGLQVVDQDMLGEVRAVHSLSGGESFLISLALALGLSSLSSNRMKVESLFIDEGFGSLDIDTLRIAMDALERLQTQGRKIGVISHVFEMTERIATQVRVIRGSGGKSRVEVK